jgi:predicted transcriptional regulator
MNWRASLGVACVWMAVLTAAVVVPQPVASISSGNGPVAAQITYSPDPVHAGDTVNISILLQSKHNAILDCHYRIFAGWNNILANGTVQLQPGANVTLTAQWMATQAELDVPDFPLGINVTDEPNGGYWGFTEIVYVTAGPLAAAVSISPSALRVNDAATITVKLCNTAEYMLFDIHYVIYAGPGNYLSSGNLPELWPAATCQSVPGGGEILKALWIPAAPGTYKVGVNASDASGKVAVVKTIDVGVSGDVPPSFALTVTPASVTVEPGTSFNVAASVAYNEGTTLPLQGKNTQIVSPPRGAFVNGNVTIVAWVQTCNCTGLTELYVDGVFHSNGTPMRTMGELNGTYFEIFEHYWDSTSSSPGWHDLIVLGKHKENFDTVRVYVNATSELSVSNIPPGWAYDPSGINFTPEEDAPVTMSMTFAVPADAPNGTYSIVLLVTGPLDKMLAEALVTVLVVSGTAPSQLADLGISSADISISPDPATEGSTCTLLATVRNIGSVKGIGIVRVSDKNGTSIGSQNISLDAGKWINLSLPWNPSAGNHTIEVLVQTLSGGNRDTLNDLATRTFSISPASPPPPVPRLLLQLEKDSADISPGGAVLVTVHVLCRDAGVGGVLLTAAPLDGFWVGVDVLSPPPAVLAPGEDWKCQLRLRAPMAPGNHSLYGTVRITLAGTGATGDSRDLVVAISEVAPARTESPVVAIGAAAAVSIIVVAAIAVGWTEVGLVALTSLLLPLYSKIRKDEVLDQFTRGKIQGYITAYPGEHYNSIKVQLGINNGALAYHLKVLEREGFVTSIRDGVYKRYYPKETILPRRRGQFSQMQQMIIGHISEAPGISQDGLARRMKVSNQVVYYHIRNLMAAGAVRLEKDGKETHCFLNEFEGAGYRGPGAG